jgi:hypothetical protein
MMKISLVWFSSSSLVSFLGCITRGVVSLSVSAAAAVTSVPELAIEAIGRGFMDSLGALMISPSFLSED